jgi:hypothetical protein
MHKNTEVEIVRTVAKTINGKNYENGKRRDNLTNRIKSKKDQYR